MFINHSTMLKFVLCLTLLAVTVKSKNLNFKVCGQELTDTIRRYCSGRYFSRSPVDAKRSPSNNRDVGFHFNPNNDLSMLENEIILQSLDSSPPNDYAAISELHTRQRRQGLYLVSNIVNDCCKNSCSLRTLISYCYEIDV